MSKPKYMPTPEQIRAECLAIQDEWDVHGERQSRIVDDRDRRQSSGWCAEVRAVREEPELNTEGEDEE